MTVAGRVRPIIKGRSGRLIIANFCHDEEKICERRGNCGLMAGKEEAQVFHTLAQQANWQGLAFTSCAFGRAVAEYWHSVCFGWANISSNSSFAPKAIPTVLEHTEADSFPNGLEKHEIY